MLHEKKYKREVSANNREFANWIRYAIDNMPGFLTTLNQ